MNEYDYTDPASIEAFAKKLLGKSLNEYFHGNIEQQYHGKGKLGQLLEKEFFKYEINSRPEPDFAEAGVELKSTPVKYVNNGKKLVSKERLVLNIINYEEEWKYSFKDSSFWHKNHHLLLMFYLWEKGQLDIDAVFEIIRLWRFPAEDLKIIKDDWNIIHKKILEGKADEISEGDTFYLAACMKGANKNSLRKQPFSDIPAVQRAYSLKNKYMNTIIDLSLAGIEPKIDEEEINWVLDEWEDGMAREPFAAYRARKKIEEMEAIVKSVEQYDSPDETFEQYVEKRFRPYYGKTETEIAAMLDLDLEKLNASKAKFPMLARAILGVKSNKIEEFEKAGILMKTIRLTANNTLKEAMSFKNIQYKEIIDEEWEDSYWYDALTHKLFFVIFQANEAGLYYLKNAFFWNMPNADLEVAHGFWEDTKAKIANLDFTHFIKASENPICHVRPKGKDSSDLMEAADGSMQKKYCYWLNRAYIKDIIDRRQLEDELRADNEKTNATVLVGYVPSKAHMDWILSKRIYNVRFGDVRGGANIDGKLVRCKYLVLYQGAKLEPSIFKLDASGPVLWGKDRLANNGYPSTPHAKSYLVFHIVEEEKNENLSKVNLSSFSAYSKRYNAPFVVSLEDLMPVSDIKKNIE